MLSRITSTFHGRDIFSPIGAHLALGMPIEDVGPAIAAERPRRRSASRQPPVADGALETAVVYVDSFGNVRLGGRPADLEAAIGSLEPGRPIESRRSAPTRPSTTWQRTFGQVAEGQSLLYEDSFGHDLVRRQPGQRRRSPRPRRWTSRSGSGRPDDGPTRHHVPHRLRARRRRPSAAASCSGSPRTRTSSTSTTRSRATRSATAPATPRLRAAAHAGRRPTSRSSTPASGRTRLPDRDQGRPGRRPDRPGQRAAHRRRRAARRHRRGPRRSRTAT